MRPRLPPEERSQRLPWRVTPELRRQIRAAAQLQGISEGELAREAIRSYCEGCFALLRSPLRADKQAE